MKLSRNIFYLLFFPFILGCAQQTLNDVKENTQEGIDKRQKRSIVYPTQTTFTPTLSCLGETFDKESPIDRSKKNVSHPRYYSLTATDIKDMTGESGSTGETSLSISGREQIINSLAQFGQHRIIDHDNSVLRSSHIVPVITDEKAKSLYSIAKEAIAKAIVLKHGISPTDIQLTNEFNRVKSEVITIYKNRLFNFQNEHALWTKKKDKITKDFVRHYLKKDGHHNSPPPHNALIDQYLQAIIGPEPVIPDIYSIWGEYLETGIDGQYIPENWKLNPGILSRVDYIITGAITEYQEDLVRQNRGANIGALNINNEARSVEVAVDLRIVKAGNAQIETDPIYNKPLVVSFRNTLIFQQGNANLYYLAGDDLFGPTFSEGISDPTDYAVRELMEAATSVLLARLNGATPEQFSQCIPGSLSQADKEKIMELFFMINRIKGEGNAVPF